MPGTVITSMIKRADVAVFDAVKDVAEGKFHGGLLSFGLAEDGVGYVSEGDHAAAITPEIRAKVADLRARIVKGEIKVPDK